MVHREMHDEKIKAFEDELYMWAGGEPYNYDHILHMTNFIICPYFNVYSWKNIWSPKGTQEEVFALMRKHKIFMVIGSVSTNGGGEWLAYRLESFKSFDDVFKKKLHPGEY